MGCTNSAPAAKATVASPKAVPGSPVAPGVGGRGRAASNRSNGSSADGHTGKQPAVADNGLHTLTTSQSVVASDKLADAVFTLDVSDDLDDTNGGQQHDGSSPVSDPSATGDAGDTHSHHSSSHCTGLGRSSPRSRVNSGAGVGAGAGAAARHAGHADGRARRHFSTRVPRGIRRGMCARREARGRVANYPSSSPLRRLRNGSIWATPFWRSTVRRSGGSTITRFWRRRSVRWSVPLR